MASFPHDVTPALTTRIDSALDRRFAVPIAVGLLTFVICSIAISTPSLWWDEAATISGSTRSIPQLLDMAATYDAVHALYYAIMHGVFEVFGVSPLTLRIPSAIALGITAGLLVVLGRALRLPRAGLVAGLILPFIPYANFIAGEGRSTAMAALLATLATLVLVRAMEGAGWWWVLYAGIALVAILLFIYLALVIVTHGIAIAVLALTRRVPGARLRNWTIAAGSAIVALAPFALLAASQSAQVDWVPPIGLSTVDDVLRAQWFSGNMPLVLLGWGLMTWGCVALTRTTDRVPLVIIASIVIVPTVALIAVSLVNPLYHPRYVSMTTPIVALAMAVGLTSIPRRSLAYVVGLAIVVAGIPTLVSNRVPDGKGTEWQALSEDLASQRALDDGDAAVIFGPLSLLDSSTRVISVAYPEGFDGMIDVTLDRSAIENAAIFPSDLPLDEAFPRLENASAVYLVGGDLEDPLEAARHELLEAGWVSTSVRVFDGATLERFVRD